MTSDDKVIVTIRLSGSRLGDYRRAAEAVRRKFGDDGWRKPTGWVWHHLEDGRTLQLVPAPLHGSMPHTGGFALNAETPEATPAAGTPADPRPLSGGFPPPSETLLNELEEILGVPLPVEYRAFLAAYNGGCPRAACFTGLESGPAEMVDHFFGVEPAADDDLVSVLERYEGRLPQGFLPVAQDPFGNLICLSIEGPDRGRVFFWDHEREPTAESPEIVNISLIAHSFQAFLASFFALDEG